LGMVLPSPRAFFFFPSTIPHYGEFEEFPLIRAASFFSPFAQGERSRDSVPSTLRTYFLQFGIPRDQQKDSIFSEAADPEPFFPHSDLSPLFFIRKGPSSCTKAPPFPDSPSPLRCLGAESYVVLCKGRVFFPAPLCLFQQDFPSLSTQAFFFFLLDDIQEHLRKP